MGIPETASVSEDRHLKIKAAEMNAQLRDLFPRSGRRILPENKELNALSLALVTLNFDVRDEILNLIISGIRKESLLHSLVLAFIQRGYDRKEHGTVESDVSDNGFYRRTKITRNIYGESCEPSASFEVTIMDTGISTIIGDFDYENPNTDPIIWIPDFNASF